MEKLETTPNKPTSSVTVVLEDGRGVIIRQGSWEKCFKRALELEAVQVLDRHDHLWVRDGTAFHSMGIQKPPRNGKMKRIQ